MRVTLPLIVLVLILILILSRTWLPVPKPEQEWSQDGGGCCGMDFRPKSVRINDKDISLAQLQYSLARHNNMAKIGIVPMVPLHQELGLTRVELDTLLSGDT